MIPLQAVIMRRTLSNFELGNAILESPVRAKSLGIAAVVRPSRRLASLPLKNQPTLVLVNTKLVVAQEVHAQQTINRFTQL